MFFSLNFNLWLKWIDDRLAIQNLDKEKFENEVSEDIALQLWTPPLLFANNDKRQYVKYVPSSSVMLLERNGTGKEAPLYQMAEAKVYDSKHTKIWFRSNHYLKFKCQFDLKYFPFDHQICKVQVKLQRNAFHGILNLYHLQIYLLTINLNQVTVPPTKRGKIGLIPGVVKLYAVTEGLIGQDLIIELEA